MSLLRSSFMQSAEKAIAAFGEQVDATLQVAQWGKDGSQAPTGMVDLSTIPGGPELFTEFLERQSRKEREGFSPGDVATAAVSHPSVQQEMAQHDP